MAKRGCVGIFDVLLRNYRHHGMKQVVRNLSSISAVNVEEKWRLLSAVCVERWPVITQPTNKMEEKFGRLLQAIELENSLLSDHEVRHRQDLKLEARRKLEDYEETDIEASTQTALDAEDLWESEAKEFIPADKITEADRTGDMKSVERKLDEKLVLLVKQKLGDSSHWVFPQGEWTKGESMRETAERVLSSHCGDQLTAEFLGHAPCGVHKYMFKSNPHLGTGAKVFFFKASYKNGDVKLNTDNVEDHLWVTKKELKNYLQGSYLKSINPFLLDL